MKEKDAEKFWNEILQYGDAQYSLGNEGNSGEFHNAKDAIDCMNSLKSIQAKLVKTFAKATQWRPVFVEGTKANAFKNEWKFEKLGR